MAFHLTCELLVFTNDMYMDPTNRIYLIGTHSMQQLCPPIETLFSVLAAFLLFM